MTLHDRFAVVVGGTAIAIIIAVGSAFMIAGVSAALAPTAAEPEVPAPRLGSGASFPTAWDAILGGAERILVSPSDCALSMPLHGIPPHDVECPCAEPAEGRVCHLVRWVWPHSGL